MRSTVHGKGGDQVEYGQHEIHRRKPANEAGRARAESLPNRSYPLARRQRETAAPR